MRARAYSLRMRNLYPSNSARARAIIYSAVQHASDNGTPGGSEVPKHVYQEKN